MQWAGDSARRGGSIKRAQAKYYSITCYQGLSTVLINFVNTSHAEHWAAPAPAQAEPSWLIYRPSFSTFIELLLSKGFYPSYFIQLAWLAGIPVWLIEKFTLIIFINCFCHVLVTFVLPQDNHKRIEELRFKHCIMYYGHINHTLIPDNHTKRGSERIVK